MLPGPLLSLMDRLSRRWASRANNPHFNEPNTQVGNRNFGVITSAGAPRIFQFGLKLVF